MIIKQDELDTVLGLEELRQCVRFKLEKADHVMRTNTYTQCVMRSSVYFMSPYNMNGEAMLPTVIKIKSAASARREREAMEHARAHFGDYSMRLIDFYEKNDIGVLQLEISGSRCCIPRFVNAVDQTRELGHKFTEALERAESGETVPMDKVLNMVNEICLAVLKPCVCRTLKSHVEDNFMRTLHGPQVKTRILGTSPATKFGTAYYDGLITLDQYGGLLSDQQEQNPETPARGDLLAEMMQRTTGSFVPPSQFFASFYRSMEACLPSKLVLTTLKAIVHNDLHFGNIMVDADDRLWIIDLETVGEGHVFTDLAKVLACGLFCFPKDMETEEEEECMRGLMLLWASAPENMMDKALPRPPADCTPSVRGIWRFAWQMQRHFAHFSTLIRSGSSDVKDAGRQSWFKLEKPHLQMLWALYTASATMVTYKQNANFPKRKRLALFLASSIAARIQHEVAGASAPAWLEQHEGFWSSFREEVAEPRFTTSARERYSFLVHSIEAWVRDPFTHHRFDVLKDTVQVVLQRLDTSGFDAPPQDARPPPTGYKEVADLLVETRRLVIVGAAGSGKTILTKQLITYMLNESVSHGRLPVRIQLIDLWGLTTGDNANMPAAELLSLYIRVNFDEGIARIVETARHSSGLILIMDGLDEAEEKGWIHEFVQGMSKEDHIMMITTRPSAMEMNPRFADNPLARWWRGPNAYDRVKFTQEQVKEWGFSVCEIKEFGPKQLTTLAESRFGSEMAREIKDDLLQDAYRDLVRVPLLATMMMHMIVQQLSSSEREVLTHCDVIEFAFTQLVRHVDAAKRRSPKEFDVLVHAEKLIYELAYKKQATRSKTIRQSDLCDSTDEITRRNGLALWKLGRSGQLALFEVCGDHLQFFHLMIQEYLAAAHVFTLLERGEKFPAWLHEDDEFALGAHHFFGALSMQKNFAIRQHIDESEVGPANVRSNLLRLLQRAFVVGDRFAIEGLFNLFSRMSLPSFHLDLSGRGLKKVDQIGRGLKKLTNLEVLDLSLRWCTQLARIGALGRAFQRLISLRQLKLDLTGCWSMKTLDGLADGLCSLTGLRELDVVFHECRRLQKVEELGAGLPNLVSLVTLRLDFSRCEKLSSLAEVGKGISTLNQLTKFILDVSNCSSLDSLDEIGKGLAKLNNLSFLRLFANNTPRVQVDEVSKGIAKLTHLWYFSADGKIYGHYFSCRNVCTGRWRLRHFFVFAIAYAVESVHALIIFVIILCQFIVLLILDRV
eukprot:CAMPEP_0178465680 /NCGR_PEP_ID=MMETSP0689_2-20121128/51489_1 /TAXON_ID=160604 /ORGANISM="Amphidinium massartii, Strain CS-259" /LENGTH=1237 /DNA_ID=CAMNT_0020092633 /DNA_START=429 /DNA_END=4142 /DNA_ORIENTATION=+